MSKKIEPIILTIELCSDIDDINGLQVCMAGIEMLSKSMVKTTLNYLFNRYVTNKHSFIDEK